MPEQWLDYRDLAAHWGIGPDAARARVRRGNFTRRTNNFGEVEVLLDTDAPIPRPRKRGQDEQSGTATPNTESPPAATAEALEALQGHIDTLREQLAKAEAIAADRGREVAAAHEHLAKLSAEMLRITAELLEVRKVEATRPRSWWRWLAG